MARLIDFLYLDIERVKSLLSQLEGGVVTEIVEQKRTASGGKAGASIFNMIEIGGNLLTEKSQEQTKTLRDALYIIFEEAAEKQGLFADASDLTDESAWRSGLIHSTLKEGQLLKLAAPTRILDSRHFNQRVDAFMSWTRSIVGFNQSQELNAIQNERKRADVLASKVAEFMGGPGALDGIKRVGDFVESFMFGQVLVRQFPCGSAYLDFSILGILNDAEGALQENRELLFSKYGYGISQWTMVSQIAAIPIKGGLVTEMDPKNLDLADSTSVSRSTFESAAVNMMQMMEGLGFAAGPRYPSISVTPIAVFREIATA